MRDSIAPIFSYNSPMNNTLTVRTSILHQPIKVFFVAAVVASVWLLSDGSFWNLWSLHRNEKAMQLRLQTLQQDVKDLLFIVEAARSNSFIERQATEQLGLVRDDELVFVFADGE